MSKKPHIDLEKSPSHRNVLVCGAPERAAWIAQLLGDSRQVAQKREYHSYLGRFRDQDVLVTSHGVGAAGAAICFQELIDVGAERIIRLGTAGGLYDEVQVGDIVIPTAAVRQDGVSRLMIPPEFPAVADLEMTRLLIEKTLARSGVVVSSDLFYPGLLDGQLTLYRDAGAIAVEMECSALFVIGQLRRVKTAAALVLDGNPLKWSEGHYNPGSPRMRESLEKAVLACFEVLTSAGQP